MFLDESAFDIDEIPNAQPSLREVQSDTTGFGGRTARNRDMAIDLDADMEDLSLGKLGSAGGIGTSSASRARMLAQEREKQMKKRNNTSQMGMVRSSHDSTSAASSTQFTPSVRQFSAPKAVIQSDSSGVSDFSPRAIRSPAREKAVRSQLDVDAGAPADGRRRGPKERGPDRGNTRRAYSSRNYGEEEDYGPPRLAGSREESRRGWDDRVDRSREGGGRSMGRREEDMYDNDRRGGRGGRSEERDRDYGYDRDDYGRGGARGGGWDRDRDRDRGGRRRGDSDEEDYGRGGFGGGRRQRSRSPPKSYGSGGGRRSRDRSRSPYEDRRGGSRGASREGDDYYRADRERDRDRVRGERGGRGGGRGYDEVDVPDDRRGLRAAGSGGNQTGSSRGSDRRRGGGGGGEFSDDYDSEAEERWNSAGQERGMVGPGSRGGSRTGERDKNPSPAPIIAPSVDLDLSDMTRFLMRPLPRGAGVVQCTIVRNKSGTNKLFPIYSLYLKDNDRFLMCSKKRANNKTSNYLISKGEHDLSRDSPNYLGKLRSNFVGTEFQVYDNGVSPDGEEGVRGAEVRRELGAVMYAPNVLGSRGPRKMQVCIPCVDESNAIVTWRQQRGSDGEILQRMKDRNFRDLCYLINKPPRWNEQVGAYVLNFSGRVTMASVKNFQLVDPDEQNAVILQFGRVGKDQFTMDMQWPMSPFQAFAITLSSFDSKIACD